MDVVSENVRESNHATTMAPAATHDERIRSAAAREGNATAVTDSSTEGITMTEIRISTSNRRSRDGKRKIRRAFRK